MCQSKLKASRPTVPSGSLSGLDLEAVEASSDVHTILLIDDQHARVFEVESDPHGVGTPYLQVAMSRDPLRETISKRDRRRVVRLVFRTQLERRDGRYADWGSFADSHRSNHYSQRTPA